MATIAVNKSTVKLLYTLWLLAFLMLVFTMTHKFIVISGDSMYPTLHDGDIVMSAKVISPKLGEVYMITIPDEEYFAVKRLVGLPGDVVELRDGALYRNDVLIMEVIGESWDNALFNLGADEYLFMGDNRAESYDGRHWSRAVKLKEIHYRLDRVVFPFSRIREVGDLLLEPEVS